MDIYLDNNKSVSVENADTNKRDHDTSNPEFFVTPLKKRVTLPVLEKALKSKKSSGFKSLQKSIALDEEESVAAKRPDNGIIESSVCARDVPPSSFNSEDIHMRVVYPYASLMGRILSRVGTLSEEDPTIELDFDPNTGMRVIHMHDTGVIMVDLRVPKSSFSKYSCTQHRSFPLYYDQIRGFSKSCNIQHTLTFEDVPSVHPDRLCARMHSSESDRIRYFHIREATNLGHIPSIDVHAFTYPVSVTLPASKFAAECRVCADNGANLVKFDVDIRQSLSKPKLIIRSYSDASGNNLEECESRISVTSVTKDSGIADQAFSIQFLRMLASFESVSNEVTLHFGLQNAPMWGEFVIRNGAGKNKKNVVEQGSCVGTIDVLLGYRP